jgi:predicted anti-sigma-YlaC factor YlaD
MSRQGVQGEPASRSRKHFDRAVELTGGQAAGPYVAFAESVSVQNQNRKEFESLLASAVAVDPDLRPEWRLANLVAQRRAKWLQGRVEQLFLLPDDSTK